MVSAELHPFKPTAEKKKSFQEFGCILLCLFLFFNFTAVNEILIDSSHPILQMLAEHNLLKTGYGLHYFEYLIFYNSFLCDVKFYPVIAIPQKEHPYSVVY